MRSYSIIFLIIIVVLFFLPLQLFSQSENSLIDPFFMDNMVLPANKPFTLFGKGKMGESILLSIHIKDGNVLYQSQTRVDAGGSWMVEVIDLPLSSDAVQVSVKSDSTVQYLDNVLIGDLYLAAGQSNMLFSLSSAKDYRKLKKGSQQLNIRLCSVFPAWQPISKALTENELSSPNANDYWKPIQWQQANPQSVASFSAVAWAAVRKVSMETGRPIGIIQLAVGGAPLESFLPKEASRPFLRDGKDWLDSLYYPAWCQQRAKTNLSTLIQQGSQLDQIFHYFAPGAIFGKMKTLFQLPFTGVFWYQGESNAPDEEFPWYSGGFSVQDSKEKMLNLLSIFQSLNQASVPVFMIQLPSMERNWPRFREIQSQVMEESGNELIITLDTGDQYNVHPRKKRVIGERLADAVLRRVYSMDKATNPQLKNILKQGDHFILTFSQDLVSSDRAPIRGFELSGESLKFHSAQATIDGNTVIIRCSKVSHPQFVRFGWQGYARVNLMGKNSSLPVAPFRTDDVTPIRVACCGDSITFGHGIKNRANKSYPALLQKYLGGSYLVGNFGNSGSCVNRLSIRNDEPRGYHYSSEFLTSLAFEADILIVNLGINDIMDWNRFGKDHFKVDYLRLIDQWKAVNPEVEIWLWSPLTPLIEGQSFYSDPGVPEINLLIGEVAKTAGVSLLDLRTPFSGHNELFPDKLHPNAAGAAIIMKTISKIVFGSR